MTELPNETTNPEEHIAGLDWAAEYNHGFDVGQYLPEAVRPLLNLLLDYPWLVVFLLLIIGYAVGKLIQVILGFSLDRVARKTNVALDSLVVKKLLAPVLQTTVILSLMLSVKALILSEFAEVVIIRVLGTALIVFWARAWFKATSLLLPILSREEGRFQVVAPRTVPLFEMGIKLIMVSVFVWFFMALWGIDGTAWLASAGVAGIAIGFAARDTLANLISGVSIVADAPYKLGDYIVLDTGERGVVTGLGMRSTRLVTRDDVEISIPNAVMGNAKITNECGGPATQNRIRVPVGVAYGSDIPKVVALLQQVAEGNPQILDHPPPRVRMRAFGASSLDFEVLGWIAFPEQRGLVIHELLMTIDKCFREHEIVIPFPQQDLHIQTAQPNISDSTSVADIRLAHSAK
jgi:MscS family membrane protein